MNLKNQYFAEMFRNDYYTVEVVFADQLEPGEYSYFRDSSGGKSLRVNNPTVKTYTYKVPKDTKLEPLSRIFVQVPDKTLKCVTVQKVNPDPSVHKDNGFDYKWIVGLESEVLASMNANIEKDDKIRRGVDKLERALARVSLQEQLKLAVATLDDATKKELSELFGTNLLLPGEK